MQLMNCGSAHQGLIKLESLWIPAVQREHEIEIGYPTDVRHVSHIGFGANGSCPSWVRDHLLTPVILQEKENIFLAITNDHWF